MVTVVGEPGLRTGGMTCDSGAIEALACEVPTRVAVPGPAPADPRAPGLPSRRRPGPSATSSSLADPILTARTMQRTPIDFAARGIWLDANALETL
jgi:hypothetical protein